MMHDSEGIIFPERCLEGLFQAGAWYDGSTSTAMVKEI
jgi:hypothetical protein